MEWSSDDEDIPPAASLQFSGSVASPCFLVQNSQPSPKKQIPGSLLSGLSQVSIEAIVSDADLPWIKHGLNSQKHTVEVKA